MFTIHKVSVTDKIFTTILISQLMAVGATLKTGRTVLQNVVKELELEAGLVPTLPNQMVVQIAWEMVKKQNLVTLIRAQVFNLNWCYSQSNIYDVCINLVV